MTFDVAQINEVLATTRAVRRRLDLERPVDNKLLLDCIDLQPAPRARRPQLSRVLS